MAPVRSRAQGLHAQACRESCCKPQPHSSQQRQSRRVMPRKWISELRAQETCWKVKRLPVSRSGKAKRSHESCGEVQCSEGDGPVRQGGGSGGLKKKGGQGGGKRNGLDRNLPPPDVKNEDSPSEATAASRWAPLPASKCVEYFSLFLCMCLCVWLCLVSLLFFSSYLCPLLEVGLFVSQVVSLGRLFWNILQL